MENLNNYIKKSHITAVRKFNDELRRWSESINGTPDGDVYLYEDVNTPFRLSNVRVEEGSLKYLYDGREESEKMLRMDDDGTIYEEEGMDGIIDYLKFWKSCLRRAKRYFAMDPDRLDRMAEGYENDIDDEDASD